MMHYRHPARVALDAELERLQSVAEPGTVLVGEATYRAASRAISFTEIEPRVLKGKAEPVDVFSVNLGQKL